MDIPSPFLQIHAQFENVQVYFPKDWVTIGIQNIAKAETSLKISVSISLKEVSTVLAHNWVIKCSLIHRASQGKGKLNLRGCFKVMGSLRWRVTCKKEPYKNIRT